MDIQIEPEARRVILRDAEARYPSECCGALLGNRAKRKIERARPVRNVAAHPGRHFRIDPEDLIAAQSLADAAGLDLVGFYHSHPDAPAVASRADLANLPPWHWLVIVSVLNGRAAELSILDGGGDAA